ncbi:deleted in malignant brain tumors 1 -like, partial [Paramuricea clavata]
TCRSISTLRLPSGNIKGPGYPGRYPNNTAYCWRIYVPRYYVVKLNINYLNMEACSGCTCDSVEVFDGPSERSKSLGKYCARSWRVTSSGQYLFVKFTSDSEVTGDAFSASYYKAVRGSDSGSGNNNNNNYNNVNSNNNSGAGLCKFQVSSYIQPISYPEQCLWAG